MNEITLTGRVGQNPTLRYTPGGTPVTNLSVALSDRYLDRATGTWVERATVWQDVEAWGALAENIHASITKGALVTVTGSLSDNSYTKSAREPGSEDILIRRTKLVAKDVAVSLRAATAAITKNAPAGTAPAQHD